MKIMTTAALLLGTTLYISAAEPNGRENSAASIHSSPYIPLQKNIASYQCGLALQNWKLAIQQTGESYIREIITAEGGVGAIKSYKQAENVEKKIFEKQNKLLEQQHRAQLRIARNLRAQQLQAQEAHERELRQREQEEESRRVAHLRQQQLYERQLREQEAEKERLQQLYEQQMREQEAEKELLRAKVHKQKQKKKLLKQKTEEKYQEKKLLPDYMQQHEEQLRTYVSPQTALTDMVETALSYGVHQLHKLNETHEQMVEDLQSHVDKLRDHVARGKADAAIKALSSYLIMYAPSAVSTIEINNTFLSNITTFQQTLERLENILSTIANVYESSSGRANIKHKILLNGLIESNRLILNNLPTNLNENVPASHDYEGIMACLLAYSNGETGIAFQKKGQNGTAGLTALESLIGGFAYGTSHEMYTQHPNLFNFLMQCEVDSTTFVELIEIRENLCCFYVMVTPICQPILSDSRIIQNFTGNKVGLEERANQLLEQLTISQTNSLTYQVLRGNIELWRTNKIFETIGQFEAPHDFHSYAQLYQQVQSELERNLRTLSQLSESFVNRNSKLSKLVSELSGVPFTFDHSAAYKFKDALANTLQTEPKELSIQELERTFRPYFKNSTAFNNFLGTADRMGQSKIYLSTEKTTADLILRISDAQTKHQLFLTILSTIEERYNIMPLNNFSKDKAKQKTIYYLNKMVNKYQVDTYIEMATNKRKDYYHHALIALADSDIWAIDKQEWVNFFKEAYNAYVAARNAIVALNLPQADGEGRLLPGFDFSVSEQGKKTNSSFVPLIAPPPPPPPSLKPVESWPNFIQSLKRYSLEYPHQKDLILDVLRDELKDAQLYVDYTALDIPGLKSKLRDQNINL
ncbi:MAG: hypothetical protein K0M45_11435 [Candidatus Paracaedibacteraceae bacterium]|nr:hypothetical protein [Candidatus Paracaedibacteraceae bacterium]